MYEQSGVGREPSWTQSRYHTHKNTRNFLLWLYMILFTSGVLKLKSSAHTTYGFPYMDLFVAACYNINISTIFLSLELVVIGCNSSCEMADLLICSQPVLDLFIRVNHHSVGRESSLQCSSWYIQRIIPLFFGYWCFRALQKSQFPCVCPHTWFLFWTLGTTQHTVAQTLVTHSGNNT